MSRKRLRWLPIQSARLVRIDPHEEQPITPVLDSSSRRETRSLSRTTTRICGIIYGGCSENAGTVEAVFGRICGDSRRSARASPISS